MSNRRYLSTIEAAALIGVSRQFLDTDRHRAKVNSTPPKIPYIRLGRTIRYDRLRLDKALAQATVE